jgi:TatD DNase family protein
MLIDTHCHLDRYSHPDRIAREAERAGVLIVAMTNLPSHFQQGRTPAARLKNVRLSLGLHPMLAPHSEVELRLFSEMLATTTFIGEVGLDFTKEGMKTADAQRVAFEFVLKQIRGKGKILSIHSRKAERAVLEALMKYDTRSAIFHWFTGESSVLEKVVTGGYFVSINGSMLDNEKGRSQIRDLPRSQALFETDGPFGKLASKPARPKDIPIVAQRLAELWKVSSSDVVHQVSENFRRLLSLAETNKRSA